MRHSFSLMTAIALCLSAQICWAECSGPAVDKNGDGSIDYCEANCLSTRECCAAVGGIPIRVAKCRVKNGWMANVKSVLRPITNVALFGLCR